MKAPIVVVGIVLYGTKYLDASLRSILDQTYGHYRVLLLDQEEPVFSASDLLETDLRALAEDPRVTLFTGANRMHSGGHNRLIEKALEMGAEHYLVASNDMFYDRHFLERLMETRQHAKYAAFSVVAPKLLRWDHKTLVRSGDVRESKTERIDSCGIRITRWHAFSEVGAGKHDGYLWQAPREVFGPTGACALLSGDALRSIRYTRPDGHIEYFDELLHYKNDVDLAYRLQWAGNRTLLAPQAVAWHDRQAVARRVNLFDRIRERKKLSPFIRTNSLLGQEVVLIKDFFPGFSLWTRLLTYGARSIRHLYALLFERDTLSAFTQVRKAMPAIIDRRIAAPRSISASRIEYFMKHPHVPLS